MVWKKKKMVMVNNSTLEGLLSKGEISAA